MAQDEPREVHCCRGCGQDTTSRSQLCADCRYAHQDEEERTEADPVELLINTGWPYPD